MSFRKSSTNSISNIDIKQRSQSVGESPKRESPSLNKSFIPTKSSDLFKSPSDSKSPGSRKSPKTIDSGFSKCRASNLENSLQRFDKLKEIRTQDHDYCQSSKSVRSKIPLRIGSRNFEISNMSKSKTNSIKSDIFKDPIDSEKSAFKDISIKTSQDDSISIGSSKSELPKDSANLPYRTHSPDSNMPSDSSDSSELVILPSIMSSDTIIPSCLNLDPSVASAAVLFRSLGNERSCSSKSNDDNISLFGMSSKDISEVEFSDLFKKFEDLKVTGRKQDKMEENVQATSLEDPHNVTSFEELNEATAIEPRRVIKARRSTQRDDSSIHNLPIPASHQDAAANIFSEILKMND